MNILISNDDGYKAPGIVSLRNALAENHSTVTVAPKGNCSGYSSAITLSRAVQVEKTEDNYFIVDGTPVDCVHLGLTVLALDPMDMVVSGINAGRNIGDDVLYSGTVGAALEGRHLLKPSVAVSLVGESPTHYDCAAKVTRLVVDKIAQAGALSDLPADTVLNINVPDLPFDSLKGLKTTRLGRRRQPQAARREHQAQTDKSVSSRPPLGHYRYWIGAAGDVEDNQPDSDHAAVQQGFVSITPLTIDLTFDQRADRLTDWVNSVDFR